MTSFFKQLNLRPQERRFVVLAAAVLFVVLNIWLIWPHFDDWKMVRAEQDKTQRTLEAYQKEVNRIPVYDAKLKELESAGSNIPEQQELDLALAVQNQARAVGPSFVQTMRPRPSGTKTNQFFEEQALDVTINTGNEELINFLVNLASTNTLIRVQNLSLKPEANNTRLGGTITFIASYQKAQPAGQAAPAGRTNAAPALRPATATRHAANESGSSGRDAGSLSLLK